MTKYHFTEEKKQFYLDNKDKMTLSTISFKIEIPKQVIIRLLKLNNMPSKE